MCEHLTVGVYSDELYSQLFDTKPVINENDRQTIVQAIKYADNVVSQSEMIVDRMANANGADVVFLENERQLGEKDWEVVMIDECDSKCSIGDLHETCGPIHGKNSQNQIVGYTTGVFDLFHIGHLNILRRAKERCDYLIVGVSTDENVMSYKHSKPTVRYEERVSIISAVRYVDQVVPQYNMDKMEAWNRFHFDELYHGDDWKGSQMYNEIEKKLRTVGCRTVFLSHTEGVSSSLLRDSIVKD